MIKIDIDTRCWQIPREEAFLGVESDDKVKILQFELSKNEFCDGLNFTDCNCFINYKNEGNDTIPYAITDMEVQENGTVTFTWEVSRGATIFKGNTFAILCAKKVSEDGTITNEWNSRIGSFTVSKGLEPLSSIAEVPEIDIISQLLLVAKQTNENAQTNINQSSQLLEKAEGLAEGIGYLKKDVDKLKGDLIDIEDTIDIHENYADSSIFNTGYYSLSDSGAINKNDSNTGFKKCKLESVPSGSYMVLNLRGIFCIVEDLVTGAKRKLATTDTYINGLITLANRSNVYLTINGNVDKTYFVSGNVPVPTYVDKVGVYSYALEDNVKPTIYVEKNGTGDFTTIKEALEYALVHPFTTIYVGNGTYDLIEEFGADYFANFTGGSRAGLKLDNYVHIIFASNSKVICNYTGDNDKIKKDFSPFNTIADGKQQKGFILENLNIECSNVRYAIHDETSGQVNPYRNIYKNCHIVLDNSNNTQGYQQCIGGGLGSSAEIIIENCYFESIHENQTYDIVSYHNGGNGKSNIVITGCYFAGIDRCRCSNYGDSTEVSTMIVSNCSLGAEPRIIDEASGANQNMRLIKWNNEIHTT